MQAHKIHPDWLTVGTEEVQISWVVTLWSKNSNGNAEPYGSLNNGCQRLCTEWKQTNKHILYLWCCSEMQTAEMFLEMSI